MTLCVTLGPMTEQQGRKAAGRIARVAADRTGLGLEKVGQRAGMGRGTLYNIFDGVASVQRRTFRAFEGATDLPWDLLWAVVEEDRNAVERMVFKDADLKRLVIAELDSIDSARVQGGSSPRRHA